MKIDLDYLDQIQERFHNKEYMNHLIGIVTGISDLGKEKRRYSRERLPLLVELLSKPRQGKLAELVYETILDIVKEEDRRIHEPEGMTVGIWLVDMNENPHAKDSRPFPGKIEFAYRLNKTNQIHKLDITDQRVGCNGRTIVFHRSDLNQLYYRSHHVITNKENYMFTADDPYGFGVLVTRLWPFSSWDLA